MIGTVVNVTYDNLGGNISLGFSSCNSTYFCRICEISRRESKTTTEDDKSKFRTKDNYAIALDIIETSQTVDFKETKGIARYCALNDLKYFHILDNFGVDIMHDVCEGAIPFLLKNLFSYCIKNSILKNEDELRNLAIYHDYGVLNSRNIPSSICFDRRNLGQNASQLKCLMQDMPYILHDFKYDPRLVYVWPSVHSMLEILQIIYDANISELDLLKLESAVSIHLKSIIENFPDSNLLIKHHLILHYANVIRAAGPVVHMSTMRFEMQHKNFTKYARRSNNFINVPKSLATNFQKSLLTKVPYQHQFNHGKLKKLQKTCIQQHETTLSNSFKKIDCISATIWLQVNNNYYREGFILKDNENKFCEIDKILFENGFFFFLCHEYELLECDWFLHSIEIKETVPLKYQILEEKSLRIKKSFTKKAAGGKSYIFADCLDVPV